MHTLTYIFQYGCPMIQHRLLTLFFYIKMICIGLKNVNLMIIRTLKFLKNSGDKKIILLISSKE
jgi:hypothetical protein